MSKLVKLLEDYQSGYLSEQMDPYESIDLILEAHEHLLQEGMFDIDEDVDYLMRKFKVSEHLEKYRKNGAYLMSKLNVTDIEPKVSSTELPSKISQKASKNNPVEIGFGVKNGNHYNPTTGEIYVGFNKHAIESLGFDGLDNKYIIEKYPSIDVEFEEFQIAGRFAHELTHWLEDSIYDNKIKKVVTKIKKDVEKKVPNALLKFRNTSPQEIESFIHQINQIKRFYAQEDWDDLSFSNLFYLHRSLGLSFKNTVTHLPQRDQKEFSRKLVMRMHRENILGDNMRNPLSVVSSQI